MDRVNGYWLLSESYILVILAAEEQKTENQTSNAGLPKQNDAANNGDGAPGATLPTPAQTAEYRVLDRHANLKQAFRYSVPVCQPHEGVRLLQSLRLLHSLRFPPGTRHLPLFHIAHLAHIVYLAALLFHFALHLSSFL